MFVIDMVTEMFSFTFIARAVIVGLLVSLCAAFLGVSLVLKRYSMIGSGLSNVGFGTLAIATAMNFAPLTVSIPAVVLAAFLLLRISENSKIKGDAAIALISTSSLAIGIVVVSMTTGMNTDVCNYMFGSILVMSQNDVTLSVVLTIVVLILFILFYNKIFAVTFDETFARATGVKAGIYNMMIAFLTAITIVLGMRMMGALLIASLIIFPALTSMRLCKKFKTVTICSAFVSVICFFIGIVGSYIFGTPAGASVVIVNIAAFLIFWLMKLIPIKKALNLTIITVIICLFVLSGCGEKNENNSGMQRIENFIEIPGGNINIDSDPSPRSIPNVVEITERMFVMQIEDIYANPKDYLGKTIKLEGIFRIDRDNEEEDRIYYTVTRGIMDYCCSPEVWGRTGLEIYWDKEYPEDYEWVEAVGVLESYEEDGQKYLHIHLTSLTVLSEWGLEYVTR